MILRPNKLIVFRHPPCQIKSADKTLTVLSALGNKALGTSYIFLIYYALLSLLSTIRMFFLHPLQYGYTTPLAALSASINLRLMPAAAQMGQYISNFNLNTPCFISLSLPTAKDGSHILCIRKRRPFP